MQSDIDLAAVTAPTLDAAALVLTDEVGVIRLWSAGAEAAFGYAAPRAIGETLDLIIPAEFREAHWQGFRRAIESGAADLDGQVAPFPVRRADGVVAETPGRLTLVRQPTGKVVGALVVFGVS